MAPEFEDGCIIVIDPAGVMESGSYVLAMHDEEYIFRQLWIEGGRFYLRAINHGYPELEVPGIEAIQGVIVQKAGTRRRHRKHYVSLNPDRPE